MAQSFECYVKGEPKPQPRPKAARRGGFIQIYTPPTAKEWRTAVEKAVASHQRREDAPGSIFSGPLSLRLAFFLKRPQRLMRAKDPSGEVSHTSTPDCDNLAKAVMDALTDTGVVWGDDSQVQDLMISKRYVSKEGQTGCLIQINPSCDKLPGG